MLENRMSREHESIKRFIRLAHKKGHHPDRIKEFLQHKGYPEHLLHEVITETAAVGSFVKLHIPIIALSIALVLGGVFLVSVLLDGPEPLEPLIDHPHPFEPDTDEQEAREDQRYDHEEPEEPREDPAVDEEPTNETRPITGGTGGGSGGGSSPPSDPPDQPDPPIEIPPMMTYAIDDTDFPNPERGFYRQVGFQPGQSFFYVLEGNYTLVQSTVRLDDYRDGPISVETLDGVEGNLNALRDRGIKIVLRFAYNYEREGEDAPLHIVLEHIEQLRPIFEAHSDVIAAHEAGFIGAWGEWHSSTNDLRAFESRTAIIQALLNTTSPDRMIKLRYPPDIMDWYPEPFDPNEAFSGSDQSRIAHHNDCFLSGPNDVGTYWSNEYTMAEQQEYLEAIGPYTPTGGETCAAGSEPRADCETALEELERFGWTTINDGYYEEILNQWKDEGCYDEIGLRLGYRYSMIEANLTEEAEHHENITISVRIENTGFGPLYNPRPLILRLENETHGVEYLTLTPDARTTLPAPGQNTTISFQLPIPDTIAPGSYRAGLFLPDENEDLWSTPRMSIRFANVDVWNEEYGYNDLLLSTTILPPSEPDDPEPPVEYELVTYTIDTTTDILNPERGWLQHSTFPGAFSGYRDQGYTVVWSGIRLDDYRDQPLNQTVFDQLETLFDALRTNGLKGKIRFSYNGNPPPLGPDAPLERILEHLEQLEPILEANEDVIAMLDAGFVGMWGEWHQSNHGLTANTPEGRAARANITAALLEALPESRMIGHRYPALLLELYGEPGYIEREEFFSGSDQSRIGWLNDCFLMGETNVGTYNNWTPPQPERFEAERNVFAQMGRYAVASAETCNAGGGLSEYNTCDAAIAEMELFSGPDLLNRQYWVDVYERWIEDGCYDEISLRLGYRIALHHAQLPVHANTGQTVVVEFSMENTGFGKVYNPRPIELVLVHGSQTQSIRLTDDARAMLPLGGENATLAFNVTIPDNLTSGAYDLYLALPDPAPSLTDDPRYSIRLANVGSWNEQYGNDLFHSVWIGGTPPPEPSINATLNGGLPDPLTITYELEHIGSPVIVTDWLINGSSHASLNLAFTDRVETATAGAVADVSTYENHATLGGGDPARTPLWRPDCIIGGCYTFDGTDDYITIATNDMWHASQTGLTVSLWFNASPRQDEEFPFLIRTFQGGSPGEGWYIGLTPWDRSIGTDYRCLGSCPHVYSNHPVNDSRWYHVALTKNGTHARLYVNGSLHDEQPYTDLIDHTGPLTIGGGTSGAFNGSIDNVLIYNHALSTGQIEAIHDYGRTGSYPLSMQPEEMRMGDGWSVRIRAVNETTSTSWYTTNTITLSPPPNITQLELVSTSEYNLSDEELTLTYETHGMDGYLLDVDWRRDGSSIAAVSYPFTDDSLLDRTTYERHATSQGPVTWEPDCRCISFDAGSIDVPSFELSERSFSIELAINPAGGEDHILFSAHSHAPETTAYITLLENGALRFSTGADETTTTAGTISFSEWNHLVLVYDHDEQTRMVYVNGHQAANGSASPYTGTEPEITIGDWPEGPYTSYRGSMHRFSVYQRALSAEQIHRLHEAHNDSEPVRMISAHETRPGEVWSAHLSATNGTDHVHAESNALYIHDEAYGPHGTIISSIEGFAHGTIGGSGGTLITVTSGDDSGTGTLREALQTEGPAWIRFDPNLELVNITSSIYAQPEKTIDGRGSNTTIYSAPDTGLWLSNNTIIYNTRFEGIDSIPIRIIGDVHNVWIAHTTFATTRDARNKAIAIGSWPITSPPPTNITIAWNRFTPYFDESDVDNRPFGILGGLDDDHSQDVNMTVTVHHNHFEKNRLRTPLWRYGYLHMYNNYIDGWASVATDIRLGARALIEHNIYEKGPGTENPAITYWIGSGSNNASVRLSGNWFVHDEPAYENDPGAVEDPNYTYELHAADDELRTLLIEQTGWRELAFPQRASSSVIIGPREVPSGTLDGATHIVSPEGSGSACTLEEPCALQTALSEVSIASHVFLRGGIYTLTEQLSISASGTDEQPIIIESYPDERAVIDGAYNPDTRVALWSDHVVLRNLNITRMAGSAGLYIQGNHNLIEGVNSYANDYSGIHIFSPYAEYPYGAYGSYNTIRDCITHSNSDVHLPSGGDHADGISISSGTGNRVLNCLSYNNSDDGIDSWRATHTLIAYSISHSNGAGPHGDGNGIKAGGPEPSNNTVVLHTLSYNNTGTGFDQNSGANVTFLYGTAYDNGRSFWTGSDTYTAYSIAAGTGSDESFGSGVMVNNSWQEAETVTFISTDPSSERFLYPTPGTIFETMGAYAEGPYTNVTQLAQISI